MGEEVTTLTPCVFMGWVRRGKEGEDEGKGGLAGVLVRMGLRMEFNEEA